MGSVSMRDLYLAHEEWLAANKLANAAWDEIYTLKTGPFLSEDSGSRCKYLHLSAKDDELWLKYCQLERKYKRENPDNQEEQAD